MSKRRDFPYRSGRCKSWINVKNSASPAMRRIADGTWCYDLISRGSLMPNFVLLTGAGFSKNWGGFVAREITNALMSQLQNNPYPLQALNRGNFEDVLSQVQSGIRPETQDRLNAMQGATGGRVRPHERPLCG